MSLKIQTNKKKLCRIVIFYYRNRKSAKKNKRKLIVKLKKKAINLLKITNNKRIHAQNSTLAYKHTDRCAHTHIRMLICS